MIFRKKGKQHERNREREREINNNNVGSDERHETM